MPIEQSRMLALFSAAEDALAALDRVGIIVAREIGVFRSGSISAEGALKNLSLLLSPDGLLSDPLTTRVTLAREGERLSPRRQREAKAKREYQKRKRGKGEESPGIEDDKEIEI